MISKREDMIFFASGVGFLSNLSQDQDHCGRCRIQTQKSGALPMSHRISKCHHISNEPPHDFRQLLTNPVYCTVFTCTLLHTSTCSCLFLFLSFCGYLSDMPETSLATEMAEIFLARSTDSLREVFLSAILYSFLLYVKMTFVAQCAVWQFTRPGIQSWTTPKLEQTLANFPKMLQLKQ